MQALLSCFVIFGPMGISFAERRAPQRSVSRRVVWDVAFHVTNGDVVSTDCQSLIIVSRWMLKFRKIDFCTLKRVPFESKLGQESGVSPGSSTWSNLSCLRFVGASFGGGTFSVCREKHARWSILKASNKYSVDFTRAGFGLEYRAVSVINKQKISHIASSAGTQHW